MKKNNKIGIWLRAFRVITLTASVIPVAAGGVLAIKSEHFNYITFLLSILAMTAQQIGANLLNDSDDYANKVDTVESINSSGVIVNKQLEYRTVKYAGYTFFLVALLIGLYPMIHGGSIVITFAVSGAAAAYFYTRKPFEFKYRGMGLPLIFLMFGPLPVLGSYYLQARHFTAVAFLVSIVIGTLTTAILHANDIRDIPTDSKAGIKTFSILVGERMAKRVYLILILSAYVLALATVATGALSPVSAVIVITFPIAVKNFKKLYSKEREALFHLDQNTAQLQLVFGILLVASLFFQ